MKGLSEQAPRRAPDGSEQPAESDRSPQPGDGDTDGNIRAAPGNAGRLIEHIQALRRYANVLVGNHADADDLVQEALKRALVYLGRDRQIDNLRAYLFTILHNVRNDALRRQARSGTAVPVEDASLVSEAASASDRIACHQVIRAMQRLSEEHRQVLLLVGVEGISYRETAAILDLPIGTVMSRLNRARAALREGLDLEGPVELDRRS